MASRVVIWGNGWSLCLLFSPTKRPLDDRRGRQVDWRKFIVRGVEHARCKVAGCFFFHRKFSAYSEFVLNFERFCTYSTFREYLRDWAQEYRLTCLEACFKQVTGGRA